MFRQSHFLGFEDGVLKEGMKRGLRGTAGSASQRLTWSTRAGVSTALKMLAKGMAEAPAWVPGGKELIADLGPFLLQSLGENREGSPLNSRLPGRATRTES